MPTIRTALAVLLLACAVAAPAAGQTGGQTAADIRAELRVLDGQIQELRNELVQRGAAGGLPTDPATALTRLDQLEAELRRLTNQVDVLTNDIGRIVADASNKVADIEFRLTELEGGEALPPPAETPLLGGGLTRPMPRPPAIGAAPGAGQAPAELTVTERSDFDAAVAAAEAGNHAEAAALFQSFLATYPGGPLSSEAQFRRGESQAALGDWGGAARSYLDAFSGAPQGPLAPRALYRLAVALGERGQVNEACLTLTEVDLRYPGSEIAGDVAAMRASLRCQ